ncbi:low-specificity L-threonine aldolase [Usitatibacter palustris]|uniref:Low specificity L-threonine aldolase n=1 Tax=Usitatibacter palustris TaxID=2732487 RepID=A0A6M4H5Z9_9PROT|nr:low-specificity L-threonine aldolase [Usitatibacter palustris]QJR15046.1 Low specificity L-threonine aldolase [Usitatibacter palustris]
MKPIDLRSDTVTRPTTAMRAAMAQAEVGDDVFGDDPTINRLQETAASMFGMDAGLFFPSGTQSNLAALMAHCQRGEEVIVGQSAHTYKYEGGGAAVLGSIQPQPLTNKPDGTLDLAEVEAAIKPDDSHFAITRLIALENTIGGKVLSRAYMADAIALARRRGLSIHLDGARIFNASVKLGMPVKDLCAGFDSVSVCLSKGLGTPAGTVLVAKAPIIEKAKRARKMLGGTMRQVGIIGAAGLYALEHHIERLADDHANAKRLGSGLERLGLVVDPVQTNMVFAAFPKEVCGPLQEHLAAEGILAFIDPRSRFVTHLDVDSAAIDRFVETVYAFLAKNTKARPAVLTQAG